MSVGVLMAGLVSLGLSGSVPPQIEPVSFSNGEIAKADIGPAFHRGEIAYRHRDYATALRWFRLAGDRGSATAQNYAGWLYENGLGTAQDYAQAMEWFRKAADQGNPDGQNYVGWLY
jgi:uncharacterized protein